MFNVKIVVVPPDGGEADYQLNTSMPALPDTGDYISVLRETGTADFIVRRRWFQFSQKVEDTKLVDVCIEVEVAEGFASDADHKSTLAMYSARGKKPKSFEATMY